MLDYKIFDLHFSYGDSKFKWKNVLFFLFQKMPWLYIHLMLSNHIKMNEASQITLEEFFYKHGTFFVAYEYQYHQHKMPISSIISVSTEKKYSTRLAFYSVATFLSCMFSFSKISHLNIYSQSYECNHIRFSLFWHSHIFVLFYFTPSRVCYECAMPIFFTLFQTALPLT